ncbi:MAG: PTS sugar transporter subunit IIA [Acidimicrobiia bacterium]|nr:PTS sugar transporter subunit IIA [Acidimicrobiia bacterium]
MARSDHQGSEIGGLLVARGIVTPGYIDGMREREETVSTYLGNGVALPHGPAQTGRIVGSGGIGARGSTRSGRPMPISCPRRGRSWSLPTRGRSKRHSRP